MKGKARPKRVILNLIQDPRYGNRTKQTRNVSPLVWLSGAYHIAGMEACVPIKTPARCFPAGVIVDRDCKSLLFMLDRWITTFSSLLKAINPAERGKEKQNHYFCTVIQLPKKFQINTIQEISNGITFIIYYKTYETRQYNK